MSGDEQEAACACGAVQVRARGAPAVVNACSCFNCQRRSGSAFSYTAFFPLDQLSVSGETHTYREMREAGRWHEAGFCPTCGVSILSRLEAFPDYLGVAAGCFTDPAFHAPGGFYWSTRRHHWLADPRDVIVHETQ